MRIDATGLMNPTGPMDRLQSMVRAANAAPSTSGSAREQEPRTDRVLLSPVAQKSALHERMKLIQERIQHIQANEEMDDETKQSMIEELKNEMLSLQEQIMQDRQKGTEGKTDKAGLPVEQEEDAIERDLLEKGFQPVNADLAKGIASASWNLGMAENAMDSYRAGERLARQSNGSSFFGGYYNGTSSVVQKDIQNGVKAMARSQADFAQYAAEARDSAQTENGQMKRSREYFTEYAAKARGSMEEYLEQEGEASVGEAAPPVAPDAVAAAAEEEAAQTEE